MSEKPPVFRIDDLSILRELQTRPDQDTLYHYTKRAGVIGIVTGKEIWASNARYLNDARELATAEEVASALLGSHSFPSDSQEAVFLDALTAVFPKVKPYLDVFVFSLSEMDDLLSQWRAYARAGDGYAVGFAVASLVALGRSCNGYLVKCHYRVDEHRRLMSRVIEEALDHLRRATARGDDAITAQAEAASVFLAGFQLISPMIKHDKFEEEQEWRLVIPFTNVWGDRARYRDGGKLLIPYVSISLEKNASVITRILIGPTPHPELEERATSGLLTVNGLAEAKVNVSRVPYRDW